MSALQETFLLKWRQLYVLLSSTANSCQPRTANQLQPRRHVHQSCSHKHRAMTDPENKGHHSRGVNFDTLGSWNNRLDMPIWYEQSIIKGIPIPRIPLDEIGIASVIGRRKVNEDRFIFKELAPQSLLYFGMFDGHGGSYAVDYVCNNLENHMLYWLTQTSDLTKVLHQSFVDINNVLTRHIVHYHAGKETFNTGTTATVCLLRNSVELVVGHVGDSCALLCRSGNPIRLTQDDDPDNAEESRRIQEHGGKIVHNSLGIAQVNGRLSMTRSIGDVELKQYGVIAKPHVRSIEVKHGKDAFLALGTDGLSFVMGDQEVVDIVGSCRDTNEAASMLTDQALQFGSEDNTTAMIIPFGAWGKYRSTTNSIPYSFGRNLFGNRFKYG
ncbi:protein phosphatase 1K, mitochondrial-like [Haliotis rufescens]|uniref:protein phosphatase 1K, mitochondrial-like n=1 Tax=Haliotis rufescens TaxID=6454 RepID=UPI001EAFF4DA|nr:protein phosphatase 1K, mitochondrial-like [Haliotis rufescens]XP_046376610.1 protein phosphatase 1K, mitochondrial-like [Haliotis rufescens]